MIKNPLAKAGDSGSVSGLGRSQWRRKWPPTPVFFPGKSHGQRNLVGYSPWGCKKARHDLVAKQQCTCPLVIFLGDLGAALVF